MNLTINNVFQRFTWYKKNRLKKLKIRFDSREFPIIPSFRLKFFIQIHDSLDNESISLTFFSSLSL